MKKLPLFIFFIVIIGAIVLILKTNKHEGPVPLPPAETSSETDIAISKPAQKDDMIVVDTPLPGSTIASPLVIKGRARGNWFFEASFPIILADWDGKIIAEGYATAEGDWMTTEYVPFTATVTFTKPDTSVSSAGYLILKKDNASGEPQFDNALEIWINY